MLHDALMAELEKRRQAAKAMGGAAKLAKRKERGQLNARSASMRWSTRAALSRLGLAWRV